MDKKFRSTSSGTNSASPLLSKLEDSFQSGNTGSSKMSFTAATAATTGSRKSSASHPFAENASSTSASSEKINAHASMAISNAGPTSTPSRNTGSFTAKANAVNKKSLKTLGFNFAKPSKQQTLITTGRGSVKLDKAPVPQEIVEKWNFMEFPEACVEIFETLMKSVGVGMVPIGADEVDWVGNFMQQLHSKLSENAKKTTLIPKSNRKLMSMVLDQCNRLIQNQRKLENIIKIQSISRSWLVRRRVQGWLNESGIPWTQTKVFQCNLAFRDLLAAEAGYIANLRQIVDFYMVPLKKQLSGRRSSLMGTLLLQQSQNEVYLKKEDFESIFSNTEELLKVHTRIFKHLETLNSKWPFIDNVGEIFLTLAPDLTAYGEYVRNSKNALDSFVRCQEQDPKFKAFVEDAAVKGGGDLMGLIVKPLNHISNYSVFLKTMSKSFPATHKDMPNIRNAYVSIKKTCKFIQDSYKGATNRAKILDVQRRVIFPQNPMELLVPKRLYIGEAPITTVEKTMVGFSMDRQRFYFLFSDILILCEEASKGFRVLHTFVFKECSITEDPVNFTQFTLVSPQFKALFSFRTKEEKQKLSNRLKDMIENETMTEKVFGVSLARILEREKPIDGIPFIVKTTVEYLKKKKETEGIFRLSGSSAEVAQLKQLFNKLKEPPSVPLDLSIFSVHSVAAILKMFFRELPEPLLTYSAWNPMISLSLEDSNEAIAILKSVVNGIPRANQVLLNYLLNFLLSVSRVGYLNKMTSANLAIVFGPNLLMPQEESIETILLIPRLNSVFQFMIEYYSEICQISPAQ